MSASTDCRCFASMSAARQPKPATSSIAIRPARVRRAGHPNGLPLFTATGSVSGFPALEAPGLAGKWRVRVKNGVVSLVELKGLVIYLR